MIMVHYARMYPDRMRKLLAVFLLAGAGLFMSAMPAGAADSTGGNQWQFQGRFYFWGADVNIGTQGGGEVEITLDEILSNFDMGLMAGIEARKGKWLLDADVIYINISGDRSAVKSIPIGLTGRHSLNAGLTADVDLEGWSVTPRVGYNLIDTEKGSLDVYAGARYLNIDVNIGLTTVVGPLTRFDNVSKSHSWWDGVVGVKGRVNLAPKWSLPYYLDGGTGDSNSVFNAFLGVAYEFEHVDAVVGYRYLKWDFKDGEPLTDLTAKGPLIGVVWNF